MHQNDDSHTLTCKIEKYLVVSECLMEKKICDLTFNEEVFVIQTRTLMMFAGLYCAWIEIAKTD